MLHLHILIIHIRYANIFSLLQIWEKKKETAENAHYGNVLLWNRTTTLDLEI